jgi:hypothetical protein
VVALAVLLSGFTLYTKKVSMYISHLENRIVLAGSKVIRFLG